MEKCINYCLKRKGRKKKKKSIATRADTFGEK
jgi:hypothetical protein